MNVDRIIKESTAAISDNYFQLPIATKENPIYRERVYCYEFYHQMRNNWLNTDNYELSGEVDKAGHPLIRGNLLDNTKPDFLIHRPGDMSGNHTIIEVKPINGSKYGIKKDLLTLTSYRRFAGYQKAILLIYGKGIINYKEKKIVELSRENSKIDLDLIELWWHHSVGCSAERIR